MEASATKSMSNRQPMTLSELLPGLSGILSKDAMRTLTTAKKKPRPTMAQTRTTEKVVRPLTIAEMRADILALKPYSPRRNQVVPSAKKRGWNSSVKVEFKKVSHTADGHLKDNPVRKVLNFQSKPKTAPNPRMTMMSTETPKFPKPEIRAKKALNNHLQAKSTVRISGICNIPQTPLESNKPVKSRMTTVNKENNPYRSNINRKSVMPPTPTNHKRFVAPRIVVDTPLSNSSWKSGSDASFLQREKEILEVEEKVKAIIEEQTLENIAEVSPPVSTPFKEYRSVQAYFNHSSYMENSAVYNDNTIMSFEKPSICKDNEKREESVIVSLCDLFTKATFTNTNKATTELDDLLEVEKQTENNLKMIENGIQIIKNIKESQLKSLQNIRKLIKEKRSGRKISESDSDKTLIEKTKETEVKDETLMSLTSERSPIISRPCSVIKKSPSYKIPRKNLCLRKKIICRSMPNVSMQTPVKDIEGRALNMYMKMKESMNFLSTPMVNRTTLVPDTPAITSHNLQQQLEKLYNGS